MPSSKKDKNFSPKLFAHELRFVSKKLSRQRLRDDNKTF